MRARLALICWAVAGTVAAQPALERNPAQRLGAELAVMAGDVRRLAAEMPGPLERRGLELRLAGALSSLPLLLRRGGGDASPVPGLRSRLERRDWPALAGQLASLRQRHRFDARPFLNPAATADTVARGAAIHAAACAGCHDAPPNQDVLLPAKNLPAQLASMPREEFAARLWLGVRGDQATALANPFSAAELADLIDGYAAAVPGTPPVNRRR